MIVKRIHVNRSISIVPMRIAICGFRIGALAVRSHNLALIVWRPGTVAATAGKLSAGRSSFVSPRGIFGQDLTNFRDVTSCR